jgi:hypothetical protein
MMPRRLPLRPDRLPTDAARAFTPHLQADSVGWARKTLAIAIHMTCLALFGLTVVWPVASPLASGELAREFAPVLQALGAPSR